MVVIKSGNLKKKKMHQSAKSLVNHAVKLAKRWKISSTAFTPKFKAIVLVDLNEFPSIFQKVQHSHSRDQKTTSNLLIIN